MAKQLWSPSQTRIEESNLFSFMQYVAIDGHAVNSYGELYDFSVRLPQLFWKYLWQYGSFVQHQEHRCVLEDGHKMPGAKWFPEARLNFAQNLLKFRDDRQAIVAYDERGKQQTLSYAQLFEKVASLSHWLKQQGIGPGDKVVGFMPNVPETIITMLAATSLGAIWSSCSPDFGLQGVVDRFGQIEAKVLLCSDGYFYAGKKQDSLAKLNKILPHLPSIEHVLVVPYVDLTINETQLNERLKDVMHLKGLHLFEKCLSEEKTNIDFASLPFDHPLYILYSSGTTGAPKCIVHGAGGTLLQHYKELVMHTDVKATDTVFYYTTCGWMMWNWMVSTLMTGATLVLFDGSPFFPGPEVLWNMAEKENISIFGTSAKYISALEKSGFIPNENHQLKQLKTVLSTGSPLSDESFEYVYRDIKQDVCLSSIAGGTDIVSAFTLGCPILPVYKGELQCIGLGMAVNVYDENGKGIKVNCEQRGELVCEVPFPSMPVGFYGDTDNKKYLSSYFETFDNIWAHGDFAQIIEHESNRKQRYQSLIIHGRSDAILNPGGVRIGTAEIYRQVEKIDVILESIAVGQELPLDKSDVRIVLFVLLRDGITLNDELKTLIKRTIRENTTPRHVPAIIVQVSDIPRTLSGKIVEVAVRETIHGREVNNRHALKNPESLTLFKNLDILSKA